MKIVECCDAGLIQYSRETPPRVSMDVYTLHVENNNKLFAEAGGGGVEVGVGKAGREVSDAADGKVQEERRHLRGCTRTTLAILGHKLFDYANGRHNHISTRILNRARFTRKK